MQWLCGALWRQLEYWTLAFALGSFFACLGLRALPPWDATCLGARVGLFVASTLMMWVEWSKVDAYVEALAAHLRESGREPPQRIGMLLLEAWTLPLLSAVLGIQAYAWLRHGAILWPGARWLVFVGFTLALFIGGITVLRVRWAARHLGERPRPPSPMPWYVGLFCGTLLLISIVGAPAMVALGTLTGVAIGIAVGVLVLLYGDPFDSLVLEEAEDTATDVELLLELGPDDHILEVIVPLLANEAVFGRAFPRIDAADHPDLGATWIVRVPASKGKALRDALRRDVENVDRIEWNALVRTDPLSRSTPCGRGWGVVPVNDPFATAQWGVEAIGGLPVLDALKRSRPRRRARIAVIDTGIHGRHPDLAAATVPRGRSDDRVGHGTAVAGAAAAVTDNGIGIASLNHDGAWLSVHSYGRMAGPHPAADDVADAILEATEDGADVIVMAFGATGEAPSAVRMAVERAVSEGILLVAAAGNSGEHDTTRWPANLPGVLSVGAATPSGRVAGFTSPSDGLAVTAPGVDVCVPALDGGYVLQDGTSIAAGIAAGAGGLLRARCPDVRGAELAQLLVDTAEQRVDDADPKPLRIDRALRALLEGGRCP